ncbi:hypothetical protein JL720_15212 [Aureococcus anophagefferens]|nr:hypothetical protein JL720_15212 [Aureococcus anophagefferens]
MAAYIVAAARTATGKQRGALRNAHPATLSAAVIDHILASLPSLDPADVDDVILGCVSQCQEQGGNIARHAVLSSTLPISVPGATIDRQCGSSQQAIHFAAQAVMSGTQDIVVAGGVESMTRVPMFSNMPGDKGGPVDAAIAAKFSTKAPFFSQFVGAEMMGVEFGVRRDEMDAFAARCRRRPRSSSSTTRASEARSAATPLARPLLAVAANDPVLMLGADPATEKLAGVAIGDVDVYEVNEAFAVVPMAWAKRCGADEAKLNIHGGACALGHPLGATGAKLATTLVHTLQREEKRFGLLAICEGAGTANATPSSAAECAEGETPSRAATMKLACLLVAGAGAFPASGRDNLAPLEEAAAAEAEAHCDVIAAADTQDLLKASYESLEDAYDADAHGHATYDCAASLVDARVRQGRALPLVASSPTARTATARAACPTASAGLYERDECESAVFNYLGFVSRKKDEPDFERRGVLPRGARAWPENCGALEYLAGSTRPRARPRT